jgi:hypothetical protein
MARDAKSFKSSISSALPGIPATSPLVTFIQTYQPYNKTASPRFIRRLRNLSDIDKHRIIVPTRVLPLNANINISYEGCQVLDYALRVRPGREIKNGTELVRVIVAIDLGAAHHRVSMDGYLESAPSLPLTLVPPDPGDDAASVEHVMNGISMTVEEIIEGLEERR